jgi:ketosteroid isomerase-like protein
MSRTNVDALGDVYAEWSQGNWRPVFDIYDPEMEWGWSAEFPTAGVYREPDERSKRLREWLSPWEDWRCEVEEYIEYGDQVVAVCRYRGRGKGSGVQVDTRGAHVWQFRDGKVIRLEVFADLTRALESVGIASDTR